MNAIERIRKLKAHLTRRRYGYYEDSCGCDDLYLVCDRRYTVFKVIVFWDDEPKGQERAERKAIRACRWLNRKPPLRVRLARILKRFDPTGNHKQFPDFRAVAEYLHGDMGDHETASS